MTSDGTVSPAQILLFGGQASAGAQSDTWRWNGATWTKLSPATSPTARSAASAVYDPLHNTVVLFGGTGSSGVLSDTWTWNGTTWTKLTPATSPAARSAAAMVWDPVHQVVVLFGGATKSSTLQDTWTWNGTTWTQLSPATKPSTRSGAAAAWDSASSSLILFGGVSGSSKLADTWRWNGTTWAQLTMTASPSARTGAMAATDPASGLLTLFGGVGSADDADTWTFNQTTWTQLTPTTSPSARDSAGLAVAADGSLVLVDGRNGTAQVSGTWSWQTVPGAPTGVTATGQNRQATVQWTAPPSGGQSISSYTVTASPGGATATSTTTSATVTGLQPATSYTFTVTATNSLGTGVASASSSAATTWSVPGAPTGVTASAGNGQAAVSWTAPSSNGGSAVTGYTVTPYIGSTAQTPTSVGGSTTSTTVTGLTNGTSYTFQVTATNVVGTGATGTSNAVTPVGVPGAPTGVTATPGNAQATVSWSAPSSNGGSAITGYTVTPYIGSTGQTPTSTGGNITSTAITGLTNGTSYTFQVTATNAIGTGPAGTSPAVTPVGPPGAPTGVTATAGNAQAAVSWTAPSSNGGSTVTGYTVTPYIGSTAQTPTNVNGSTTSTTITALTNGTSYTFQVTATNAVGTGVAGTSNAVTPVGVPGAPSGVTAIAGNAQATVSWSPPSSTGGSAITGYTVTPYVGSTAQTPVNVGASVTSTTITGLTNGTAYTFQVTATNALGTSVPATSGAVTPVGPPGAPASATATAGAGQATVSWTAPASNGGASISGYTITPYLGSTAQTAANVSGTTLSTTITGLSNGSYTFHVTATNSAGTGPAAISNGVTLGLAGPPASVTATAGGNQAAVSWTAPGDGTASMVTGYLVTAYANGSPGISMATAASTTSVTLTGLQGGVSYTVQVVAGDQYGWGTPASSAAFVPTGTPTTYASTVIADGATAFYRLDDPTGGIASDSSGMGNLANYNMNSTWGAGQTAAGTTSALANDADRATSTHAGSYQYTGGDIGDISPAALPVGTMPRTWEAWFQGGWGTVAALSGTAFTLRLNGQASIQVIAPGGTLTWTTPYIISDGAWHMVDASYDGAGTVTLYLDGVSLGALSGAGSAGTATGLSLDGASNGNDQLAYGALDEVALYDTALTSAQVTSHWTASGNTRPSAPGSVTATVGANQATVTWTAPTASVPPGASQVTLYQVTAFANGTAAKNVLIVGGGTTSVTMTGLQGGVSYSFLVAPHNEFGTGTVVTSNAVTPTGSPTSYASAVLADGPAAYYRLDDTTGFAADSSVNGNHGQYNQNQTWGAGQNQSGANGALANDTDKAASTHMGSYQYTGGDIGVPLPTGLPQGSAGRTWEGWFQGCCGTIAALGGTTFKVRVSGQYWLQVVVPGGTLTWTAPYLLTDGNWHMVDASYDGTGSVTLYLDGVNLGTQTGAGTASTATSLSMDGEVNGNDQLAPGAIDEIALYDVALSGAQVAAHWNASGDSRPAAPATVTATADANQVSVTWSAATAGVPAGASQVTDYVVTAYGNGVAQNVLITSGGATGATVSGLQGGVTYTVQVEPENQFGAGAAGTSNAVVPTGSATTYAATVLADNPAAYYRLDDTTGYAADSSSHDNRGLYNQNQTWGAGQNPSGATSALANDADAAMGAHAGSYQYTGSDVGVPLPSGLPQGSSGRSWEAWFQGSGGTIAALSGSNFQLRLGGLYWIQVTTPATTLTWTTPYLIGDGRWHMVDAVYDGVSSVTLYLDGVNLGTQSGAGTAATATGLSLDGQANGGDQLAYGAIDEVSLYGSALSGTQVAAHWSASGNSRPTAPSNVSATAGANQATVSWSAATAGVPGGAPQVSGYMVTAVANGTAANVLLAGGGATSATLTGLQGGVSYTFQVAAENEFGSGISVASNAVTPTGAPSTYASTILGDHPVAYYRLDDATAYAADSSGNNNRGLYNQNQTWGAGQYQSGAGSALANDPDPAAALHAGWAGYTGSNIAVLQSSGLPQGSSARTWEAWFQTTGTGTVVGTTGSAFRLRVNTQYSLSVTTPATILYWATPYPVTDNLWHLVDVAYDGTGSITMFLDGVSIGAQSGAGTAGTVGGLTLSADYNGGDQLLGALDEAALYNVVLSGAQVTAHWNASGDTRPVPPGVPTNVVATGGNGQATVSWTPPQSSGTGAITGYTVTPYIGTTAQAPTTVGGSTTSVTITGLANGTSYTFQVVATSAYGSSAAATSNAVMPAVLPNPPTNVVASAADGRATVSWTAPAAPGNIVKKYTVTPFVGSSAQSGLAVTVTASNGSGVTTSASVGGLTDGTAYTFQVTASNDTGTGPAGVSNAVVPAAPAPITIAPAKGYDAGATPAMVAAGDVTGDGWPDVVTANGGSNSVSALLNQVKGGGHAGGTFAQPATVTGAGTGVSQVALGDFNADGKMDLAIVNGTPTVSVMLGNGGGTFGAPIAAPALDGQSANVIAVGDMNGDGKPDIVVAGTIAAYPYGTAVDVLLSDGDGTFQAPAQKKLNDVCLGCAYGATGLALGDLNGDGVLDVAYTTDNTSHGWDSGNIQALLNNGAGGLSDPTYSVDIPGPHSAVPGGEVAVADLNGDGIPDIVALENAVYVDLNGSGGQRGISISFGQGGGSFAQPVYVPDHALVGSSNSQDFGSEDALAIADMNGDGQPDVVTADGRGTSSGISVYLNPGGGGIDAPQFIGTGAFVPQGLALADVNGDSEPDVVIENGGATGAPNVQVLLNGTDFPPLGGALAASEMHGCAMCQAMRGGGALDISGSHPITVNTGEMSHTFTDVSIPARGYALTVTQTYNDLNAGVDAGLGYGWWSPILMSVSSDASSGRTSVTQEDGAQAQFFTSTLQPVAPRTQATLAHNGDGTWTFKRYSGDTFTFNASGQITSIADRNGDVLTYGYTSGHVSSLTHSDGRSLAIAWSGSHVSSITDGNVAGTTRTVAFTYNGAGELTDIDWTVNGANDRNEHFEYESTPWSHGMTGMRDPRGVWVTQVYDASGRTTSQTIDPTSKDPAGLNRTTTYAYTLTGGMVSQVLITDPVGNQTLDTFAYGELVQKVAGYGSPNAATWTYSYDPRSAGTRMATDPDGHTSSASFDSYGNPLAATDALGRTTTYTYAGNAGADAANYQPTTVTDANGVTTTYTYDATHRTLTQSSTPLVGSSPAVNRVVQYVHGNASHPADVTSMVDPDQKTWVYGYDSVGDKTSTTDPVGDKASTTYNADGWVLTTVAPKGDPSVCTSPCTPSQYTTTYSYADGSGNINFFGAPSSVTDPLGHQTTRVYDADNNVVSLADGNGNVTTYDYDNANELTVTHRADAGHTTTSTQYNADGTVHEQIDGKGNVLQSYGYNSLDQQVSVTVDPGSSPHLNQTTSYTYDGLGNLLTKQDPGGSCTGTVSGCTTYSYDLASQLTGIAYSDGQTPNVSNVQYDADGQRTAMTDGTGQWSWQYDSLHRLTSVTEGANGTVTYQYNLRGLVTQIGYPTAGHAVPRGYDNAGRWTSVQDWNGASTTFKYDPNSNLYETDMAGTALVDTNTFNNADQLVGITDAYNGTPFFSAAYGRDANGQVTSDSSATSGQSTYQYTPLNQLCYAGSANSTPCSSPPSGAQSNAYDAADNPTTVGNVSQTFNSADQVTASGSASFQYDTRGNRVSATGGGATTSYGYDQANRLCWTAPASSGASCNAAAQSGDTVYCYNGDGLRMAKVTAGTCAAPTSSEPFVLDLAGGLPQVLTDGSTSYVDGPGGAPLEQISGATILWYHHDQLGSTRSITDGVGSVRATYTFDAYGNVQACTGTNVTSNGVTNCTGTVTNPMMFAGQYRDTESGLYFLRARYYDPATAQFTSRDPLAALTLEPYGYVADDPLNAVDASGLSGGVACDPPLDTGGCLPGEQVLQGVIEVGGSLIAVIIGTAAEVQTVPAPATDVRPNISYAKRTSADDEDDTGCLERESRRAEAQRRAANRAFDEIAKELTKSQRERLHREISKGGYTPEDIQDIADSLFGPRR